MRSQNTEITEIHTCPDLNESVTITATQRTRPGKSWIIDFNCDHYMSCPIVRVSKNTFNFDSCQLSAIFKRRGKR